MSYSVDVNILLYASNSSSAHNEKSREFMAACGRNPETMYLTWPTIMGYLRIATHPSVFRRPLPPAVAMGNMDALLSLPQVVVLAEKAGFWDLFRRTAEGFVPRGKLVPDLHLAVLLRQHEVRTLFTHDSDFRRFDFLNVMDPLA